MVTTWKIETKKKTKLDEEFHKITFTDYRGSYTIKIDNARQLLEDLDKETNYKSL